VSPLPRRKVAGHRATTVSAKALDARRASALKASIAATKRRNGEQRVVDWDAAITRFKADMAQRYADEEVANCDNDE
jgi:hypothetical protein